MFSHLTSQLRADVETAQKVLVINDALRDLLILRNAALAGLPTEPPAGSNDLIQTVHALARLLPGAPNKLDWQIYDHCAALTRLYSVYERYVDELVSEYVRLLPQLYVKYADLPVSITTQHRIGIGQILLKIGEKGPFKNLEEQVVVRELAAGLSGASGYSLLADAFFIDRQNLRFEMLGRLFSGLGFKHCGRYINLHPAITSFIKAERADSSSAEKELRDFIDYRNEAAHRKVDNVLAIDTIGSIGRFVVALGHALAEMVDDGVLGRRMELNHYSPILRVSEIHHDGYVVIGTAIANTTVAVGDEVVLYGRNVCHRVKLESIQLDGQAVQVATGDGATEIGVRLSKRAKAGAELRRLLIPIEAPKEVQLKLEDAMPAMSDEADTDVADSAESQASGATADTSQAAEAGLGDSEGTTPTEG